MKWVTMWGNAQSTVLPHPAYYAKDLTLRYPIFVPFDGNKIRITLDNYCCGEEVKINRVAIAKGSKKCELLSNITYLTFNGDLEVLIDAHGTVISDELEYNVSSDEFIFVSMYLNDFTIKTVLMFEKEWNDQQKINFLNERIDLIMNEYEKKFMCSN